MIRPTTLAVALAAVLAGPAPAGDPPGSGLKRGDVTATFKPLMVTGNKAGEHFCVICKHGNFPTAVIFARDADEQLAALVRRLEAVSRDRYGDCLFGGFVVFCSDAPGLPDRARALAQRDGLQKIEFAVDAPAGPAYYRLDPNADVTVLLTRLQRVQFNYAFRKGELTDAAADGILADLAKVLPPKRDGGR